jgi:hypothetical protein
VHDDGAIECCGSWANFGDGKFVHPRSGLEVFYVVSPTLLVSSSTGTNKWYPFFAQCLLAGTIRQFSCIRKQILFGGRRRIEKQILYRYMRCIDGC